MATPPTDPDGGPPRRKTKPLPKWVDPLFIAGFAVAAVLEYQRDEMFWFWLFVAAALYTAVTNLLQPRRK